MLRKKVAFKRKYPSHSLTWELLNYLDNNNIDYKIKGKYEKPPIFVFDEKVGGFCLSSGRLLIKNYPLDGKKLHFEILLDYCYKELDVLVVLSEKYSKYHSEIFKLLDNLSEGVGNGKIKVELNFKNKLEAFRNITKALEEEKLFYEIKPYGLKDEPIYSYKNGEKYVELGIIRIDENLYFEFSDFKVYMVSLKNDTRANNLLKKINPQKVNVEQETIINIFGGKKIKIKNYAWDDIGGLEKQKEEIKQIIEWPLQNPHILEYMGLKQPKGVLLYGPPGTGKTLIAKIIASETNAYFFHATPSELTSKWYGESEKLIKEFFNLGRRYKPSVLFIDEIDGLFVSRESGMHEATRRMFSVFLQELDGFEDLRGTVILAATNRIEDLDPALLRPGRFDRKIEIPLPDKEGRREIFRIHTRKMPIDESVDFEHLAKLTDGYSGADIEYICQRAGYNAIERFMKEKGVNLKNIKREYFTKIKIVQKDFESAIESMKNNPYTKLQIS